MAGKKSLLDFSVQFSGKRLEEEAVANGVFAEN
jgi:hypothetical protein